jgi:hypothetical protein
MMNRPFGGPEPPIRDIAGALLTLAPSERRTAVRTLLTMIERVIVDEELHRVDRSAIPSMPHRDGPPDVTCR